MHLLLVFSHNIWSHAPFFLQYRQAMLISSWSLVSRLLILYLLFHTNYYSKCLHIPLLLSMRLCPSVCSCFILDITVHGIGTLPSEHRRRLWSSSFSPIYFWWSSHSFPPFLAREHTESFLIGWVDAQTSLTVSFTLLSPIVTFGWRFCRFLSWCTVLVCVECVAPKVERI